MPLRYPQGGLPLPRGKLFGPVPTPIQRQGHEIYDTAKVLSLVHHLHGYALYQQTCPTLRHIEAVSRFMVIQSSPVWHKWRTRIRQWRRKLMGQPVELTYDQSLPHLAQVLQALAYGRPVPALPKTTTESVLPQSLYRHRKVHIVVTHPHSVITSAEVVRFCAEHLPAYMLPGTIEFRRHLPVTTTGKIDRLALQEG